MAGNEIQLERTGIHKVDLVSSALEEQARVLQASRIAYDSATTLEEKMAALKTGIVRAKGFADVIIKTYGGGPNLGQSE